jgi:iron complex outermembrane receptor protein
LEFEGIIFPTQNLELGATLSWINFAYTSSQSGAQLTQAHEFPKTKYGLSAKYHLPLSPQAGDFSLGANWGWQAHSYVGPLGDPAAPQAPYGLLNLSADWEHIGRGPLDASFFMTNATNKVYAVNDWALYAFTGTSGITYGLPRMYGVRVNYRFGAEK